MRWFLQASGAHAATVLLGLFSLAQPAAAQFVQQRPKLVGTSAVGAAEQGYAVSLSADGNTAIVGGPGDNSYNGGAWVFIRNGGVWTQQASKLVGRFHGSNRMPTKLNYQDVTATQGLARNLRWQPI
jgi:hypothetical protein